MTQLVRVAVVDDSSVDRETILEYLAQYQAHNNVHFDITPFDDGSRLLEDYRPDYDIIFLDVQMKEMDGLRTAERIRLVDSKVILVFITNMAQFAIKGYAVDALNYLLKPVPYFAFAEEMTRSLKLLQRNVTDSIVFGSGAALVRIDIADIVYAESVRHRNIVHTLDQQHAYTGTLRVLEEELEGKNFYRSNSYYLVNLRHVVGVVQDDAVMSTGDHLKISRARKKGFMEALTDYIGGRLQ